VSEPNEKPDTLLGQTLDGRFHLTRKIGEGGMGAVYEAESNGKKVAVKVLRDKYIDRPTVAQRLVQEARLAASIQHEHIVDMVDSGKTEDGRTFVVMELLAGESLAELLRREGALPEARAAELVKQVAGALAAAHAHGIVHRDVKPENVFLVAGASDFVKVVDFGISTTVRDARDAEVPGGELGRLTSTGMVLGTPFYMSPEQARGDDEIDHRIDVYALGVILYECLTGEVPFRGANYLGIISKVLNEHPVPPRQLRPELRMSEAIERVCLKAMAKSRDDRYPSMEALAADLDRALSGEGVEAPAAPAPPPQGRAWIVAAVGMALVGGLALVWAARGRPAPPQPAPAPPPVAAPAPPSAPQTIVIHVETEPPGAEVRQGDRVFGAAPRDVLLPRSNVPAHLSFVLDGYEPASADVIPQSDDSVKVKLTHIKQKRPSTAPHPHPETPAPETPKPKEKGNGETLPNPY
jgi:serine/threonine-protein kinase